MENHSERVLNTHATSNFCYPPEQDDPPETTVPLSTVCSALCEILDWITIPITLNMTAARAHTLRTWLDPVQSAYKSLNEIANYCDVSRAALSKSLLAFRDEHSIHLTIGRLESSRELYRQAQLHALEEHRHVSQRETLGKNTCK